MKQLTTKLAMIACLVLMVGTGAVIAQPYTYTGNLNIGQMMTDAQQVWDFDKNDSVLLLEGEAYVWNEDGRLEERHHRVVWISTEHAIETYADLRVPYDSERQNLKVNALRVWRNNRWIEARETAVVPTTPFAFRTAPDYTNIRETMLLHDGVELPCILEVDYVIEDKQPYRQGFEGQYTFPKINPALNSWLILMAPEATNFGDPILQMEGFNGVVKPTEDVPGSAPEGMNVYSYRMQNVEPYPLPQTADPASYLPHVQWSTYNTWPALGDEIKGSFLSNMMLNDALRDSLNTLLEDAETMSEKSHRIADFVGRSQRNISYDPKWFYPRVRKAVRTYETAYGTAIDNAVLAAALFKQAGFEVWPVLLSEGYGNINEDISTLARFQPPGVWVSGPGVEAYFDASHMSLHNGLAPIYGRTIWLPGYDEEPTVRWTGEGEASRMITSVDAEWTGDGWTGTGYYEAGGGFSPFDRLEGGGDKSKKFLGKVVGDVFPGAVLDNFNPMGFDRFTVAFDLSFTVEAGERDEFDRLPITIGTPTGGVLQMLPHDVHLYLAERGTPVSLPGSAEQMVKVKLTLNGLENVRLPEPQTIENEAGSFRLEVERDGDVVTITRYVSIGSARYTPDQWPELRDLLLAETYKGHRTVLLK